MNCILCQDIIRIYLVNSIYQFNTLILINLILALKNKYVNKKLNKIKYNKN